MQIAEMTHVDVFVPVNYINPEACALLAAAEASSARRADDLDAGIIELSVKDRGQKLGGFYDLERILPKTALPKRFFLIFLKYFKAPSPLKETQL